MSPGRPIPSIPRSEHEERVRRTRPLLGVGTTSRDRPALGPPRSGDGHGRRAVYRRRRCSPTSKSRTVVGPSARILIDPLPSLVTSRVQLHPGPRQHTGKVTDRVLEENLLGRHRGRAADAAQHRQHRTHEDESLSHEDLRSSSIAARLRRTPPEPGHPLPPRACPDQRSGCAARVSRSARSRRAGEAFEKAFRW